MFHGLSMAFLVLRLLMNNASLLVLLVLVRTNVQYLVVHTIYYRCGHLGRRAELDST